MITIYIKELGKEEICKYKFLEKVIRPIIIKINIPILRKIEKNKMIIFVPNGQDNRIYKKINKKISKQKTKTQKIQIVLEKKLYKYKEEFKNYKIIEGKNIFYEKIEDIIKFIIKEQKLELQKIYFVTNRYINQNVNIISKIAPKVQNVNIITKEVTNYNKLEEILLEKGIPISVSNNMKKSLKKAKIIINLDLQEEDLKKYVINRNAVIINMNLEKITNMKYFEGIIIQDMELNLPEKETNLIKDNKLDIQFRKVDTYESIKENIDISKTKIINLYGNNGKISEKELLNVQKILTNEKN